MRVEYAFVQPHGPHTRWGKGPSRPRTEGAGARATRDVVYVRLVDGNDEGFGEATTAPGIGGDEVDTVRALARLAPLLEHMDLTSPWELWRTLAPRLEGSPAALCAIDLAAWDLVARRAGLSLRGLLGIPLTQRAESLLACGPSSPAELESLLEAHPRWARIHLTLGNEHDLSNMRLLSRARPRSVASARGAWSLPHARRMLEALEVGGLAGLLDPLVPAAESATALLKLGSPVPLFARARFRGHGDLDACHEGFDGVIVRPGLCGGLTGALQARARARERNMAVALEAPQGGAIATTAWAQVAPLFDFASFASARPHEDDPAEGFAFEDGTTFVSARPGLGLTWRAPVRWILT